MKSSIDSETRRERGVRAKAPEVPGGKVLQRLELFGAQRGFDMGQPIVDVDKLVAAMEKEKAAAKAKKKKKTKARSRAKRRGIGTFAAADMAALYMAGAESLEAAATETPAAAAPGAEPLGPQAPAAPSWRLVGPRLIPDGQTYGAGRTPVSGRVSSVAVDPSNANHILCGSAAGGVWESRNGGASWAPRTDRMPTLTTGAIAFDPTSPNVVYVGTGEGDFYAGFGVGILRSTNGGATWVVHASAPFVGSGFHDLVVDPANGNHLLAATTNGLFESGNGGTTWNQRRFARTWALSMHPAGGGSAEVLAACSDGLYRSGNGGQNWARVNLPGGPAAWNRLAVDHVRSNPAVAYAFGASGGTAFLYRRNAAGTWQRISTPSDLAVGQAWYDWFLAAAPDRVNQVYLGAINAHRGDLSGSTWSWINLSAKPAGGDSIHPDQHAITFHPTNASTVYVGNDGGLYRSPNRGINWESLNAGLAITEMEYIAQDPGSSRWLMGGTQDNGTNRYRGSTVWDHIADGDGGDCAVNNITPDTIFHSFFRMGFERSNDRGATWTWIPTGNRDPSIYRQLFYPPLEGRGNTVAQAGESVFISRDSGNTLREIPLPGRPVASAMHMPTPNLLLVGTTNGRIFRISWTGAAWSAPSELTRPRAGNVWVSDLYVDPSNPSRIWATYTTIGGGRVYRSDDGGTTWTDRTAGLPNLPINAVEVHPSNPNRVWVAADVGVYQSFDGGASWAAFSLGLPNVLVGDLVYQHHARVLRAGTRNRGVWEIPVDGWLEQPICGTQWTGSLAGNASARWFTFRWPATWHVLWTVMPTSPRTGGPQLTWNVQVERADAEYLTYWITVSNLTPDPVNFEGRYCILSFF